MASQQSDVIVIGGGTMGSAAGWALARRGHSVTILEQFGHYHDKGSHSGNTRIYRHAYAEGSSYVPWALQASALWRGLQERTGIKLMVETGCLDISEPGRDRANAARESAREFGLPVEELTGHEMNQRWPAWRIPDDWDVTLDPNAGFLLVEPAFRAMGAEYLDAGGVLKTNEPVLRWDASDVGVRVETDKATYEADSLVIAAGPWSGKVLSGLGVPLEVRRKPVMWFDVEEPELFQQGNFPVFVYQDGTGEFYGLPAYDGDTVKIGIHSGGDVVDPDNLDREWRESDLKPEFRAFLTSRLNGVKLSLTKSTMCMYTMTPDENFVIDRHPEHPNVAFAAGFSGHGFKFTPKVGEHLADLVTGSDQPLPLFSFNFNRFARV
jgi:sarcosine oxidase/N-methyl-L-tryptophan oxidase